jgi:CrcB protein
VNVLAVVVGGLVGTSLRLGIDALLPHDPAGFPVSTLMINVIGSFALGLLVARAWPTAPAWLRLGLGTGLLGSFTTFSAVMASLLDLASRAPMVGLGYLLASVVAGFGAAAVGLRMGRRPATEITDDE